MNISRALSVMVGLTLSLATSACSKREETPAATPAPAPSGAASAPAAAAAAPGAAGSAVIKGVVALQGTPPEVKLIKRETDPFCARKQMKEEEVIVGAG